MEAALFIFSLIDCCALIFLAVYFIITLSDLECDYINARSCCSKLNKEPEHRSHVIVTASNAFEKLSLVGFRNVPCHVMVL
ncbi:protein cornichon homolog 4-like [Ranitomeya variabilis]|uniref:protein cornichon homolog 4-like n=1 Tax=Ranitomeya variabilis TaxID=490064 RepID=UPI004056ADC6